jgi:hypothetical protein
MSSSLNGLDATVVPKFLALEAGLQKAAIKYVRFDAGRTVDEQIARFAQHRGTLVLVNLLRKKAGLAPIVEYDGKDGKKHSDNDFTSTDCDGINTPSNHQSGRAADYVVLDEKGRATWDYRKYAAQYKAIAEVARGLGFLCGADWMKKPDGNSSPYADVGLGWDPPHHELPKEATT